LARPASTVASRRQTATNNVT